MKILATAKNTGSVNALVPVIEELVQRGHKIKAYATGNDAEAAGFGNIPYVLIKPKENDYSALIKGFDLVLTGLSGYKTPDGYFIRSATQNKIPVIAVQDQDRGYLQRLGNKPEELPTFIALMNKECIDTMRKELPKEMGAEAVKRAMVVGWTAFDHYAELKKNFTQEDRAKLLREISINQENETYVYFSQNIHPETEYSKKQTWTKKQKQEDYAYEKRVTKKVFETASDLRLKLVVKPHPGEEGEFTPKLAEKHGFTYIPAKACDTKKLILSSYSVTAGRSTTLTESCLLDRNTGGIFPELNEKDLKAFPPVTQYAIPYTLTYGLIDGLMCYLTTKNKAINERLSQKRKRFSVDGMASKKLADIIESF